jgi:hypothetical protein
MDPPRRTGIGAAAASRVIKRRWHGARWREPRVGHVANSRRSPRRARAHPQGPARGRRCNGVLLLAAAAVAALVAASAATSPPNAVPEAVRARAHDANPPAAPSPPASAAAKAQSVRSRRPSPGDDIPIVRSSRPSPGDHVPTVKPRGPQGVRAPRYTQEDEEQRRDELAREAAEQARLHAERQRGPRQGQ